MYHSVQSSQLSDQPAGRAHGHRRHLHDRPQVKGKRVYTQHFIYIKEETVFPSNVDT